MADAHEYHFPEDQILVCLLRVTPRTKGLTAPEIADEIGRAQSTVRNNLQMMMQPGLRLQEPWAEIVPGSNPRRYRLTPKGREIARYRARHNKPRQEG